MPDRPTEDEVKLDEPLGFMRLLWAVDHALQSRSKAMSRDLGLTGPQRLVLRIVGGNPGISAGALARALHLHPSTLTGVLDRLVRAGHLSRRADPADARRALLALTPRGARAASIRQGTVEAAVAEVLGRHDARALDGARRLLVDLARTLEGE